MGTDFTEMLRNFAMQSNDGVLRGMAMQAAERLTSRAEDISDLRAQLAAAEADKLAFGERVRDAATDACANVIKNYDVLKPDGKTYEPIRVQKAAKGMVSLAREDIRALDLDALVEGDR